jgi:enterochelin esterase family protein
MNDPLVSPVVNKDRTISLNLKCDFAENVELGGDFRLGRDLVGPMAPESVSMKRRNGVWTYTTEPVLPGIYRYFFSLDGIRALDPLNPWKERARVRSFSLVKVAGEDVMPWDLLPNIPHGSIVVEKLHSKKLDQIKRCSVYLPPNYHLTSKKYPVLYLLHGAGGDYNQWIYKGTADNIMDYLLSKGKAKEMILVMPDGSVLSDEEYMEIMRSIALGKVYFEKSNKVISSMVSDEHLDYFVEDLIPFVEDKYRISTESRIVAGLSMGGAQTLNLITSHPDLFKAAGMFSSGPTEEARDRLSLVRDKLRNYNPIYVSCGSWDSIIEHTRSIHKALQKHEIKHLYMETDDGGHFWSVWQRNLTEFIPQLAI